MMRFSVECVKYWVFRSFDQPTPLGIVSDWRSVLRERSESKRKSVPNLNVNEGSCRKYQTGEKRAESEMLVSHQVTSA